MKNNDYYGILGIDPGATITEIRQAYRRLAHRCHPDVADDPDGEPKFKAASEAYRTLKCPEARAAYDRLSVFGTDRGVSPPVTGSFDFWFVVFQGPAWMWFWMG